MIMTLLEDFVPAPNDLTLTRPLSQIFHTVYDSFGEVMADYTFFSGPQVLYVRWHGHLTGDELVRVSQTGLLLNEQLQPRGLFHDARGTSGDWGEASASTWMEYEWIPGVQAKCPNLRCIAVLLDAKTPVPHANAQLLAQLDQQFDFQVFYSLFSACGWMEQRTRPQTT